MQHSYIHTYIHIYVYIYYNVAPVKTMQQTFKGYLPLNTAFTDTAFKPPELMAASLGFPFTHAQWNELHRQAMIYKYMMASVPVPPDLLFPFDQPPSCTPWVVGDCVNMGLSRNKDPEPGRCRRTDGKKWRCSRDAAPDQKYCERHMNRGRSRSRKHVELDYRISKNSKRNRQADNVVSSSHGAEGVSKRSIIKNNVSSSVVIGKDPLSCNGIPAFMEKSNEKHGTLGHVVSDGLDHKTSLNGSVKGQADPTTGADQQWHYGSNFSPFNYSVSEQHNQEEPLILNSYTLSGANDDQQNMEYSFFNQDLDSLGKSHVDTPRDYIDAWSNSVSNDQKNSKGNGKLLFSSTLSLAVGCSNTIEDEMGIQMGLNDTEQNHNKATKPNISCWLGGPLAEVLRPSGITFSTTTGEASNPSNEGGYSDSYPATPSGVVQTLVSLSDSSGSRNSSPKLGSSSARPKIALPLSI